MKHSAKILSFVMVLMMTLGVLGIFTMMPQEAYAADAYSYTFTSKQFSANGSKTLNGITWTLAGNGGYWGNDGTKGQQFGSGSKPYTSMTLTSSGFNGKSIESIVISTSGASDTKAKLTVTVGGNQVGTTISLTSSNTSYTFNNAGKHSGEIVLSYTQTSKKAIYIKSITVNYGSDCDHVNTTDNDNGVAATCTESGKTNSVTCLDCGETVTPQETIPALGHDYVDWKCTRCGEEQPSEATVSVDASQLNYTNGQEVSIVQIDSNVTTTFNKGTNSNSPKYYDTGKAIRVYGGGYFVISVSQGYSISKIVITFGSGDGTNAITTDVGTYSSGTWTGEASAVTFTVGGTTGHRRIQTIEVTYERGCAHSNQENVDAKDPTCTEEGREAGVVCKDCGVFVEGGEAIPATGHNWNLESICDVCGENTYSFIFNENHFSETQLSNTLGGIDWVIDTDSGDVGSSYFNEEKGHQFGKTGYGCSYLKITLSGFHNVTQIVINTSGASATEATLTVYVGGVAVGTTITPTSDAMDYTITIPEALSGDVVLSYTQTVDNTGSSQAIYLKKVEVTACNHSNVETDAAVDPDCENSGLSAGSHCATCGKVIVAQDTVDALGHDEVSHDAKAPTCTEKGWDAYVTCSRCDYTTYEEKAALGHDEVSHDAKAPTCTEIGWDAYVTCDRCDYSTYEEKAALGHTEVIDVAVAPTCTATGLTEGKHCSVCNEVLVAQEEVAAKGHDWTNNDGVCANECGAVVKFNSASITLQDNLLVNFKIDASALSEAGVSFVKAYINGVAVEGDLVFSHAVAPHQMADSIVAYFVFADANGNEYKSVEIEYSVATYCMNKFNDAESSAELKALVASILNYGAAAQVATHYNTDNLANRLLPAESQKIGEVSANAVSSQSGDVEEPSAIWVSAGLVLQDKIVIRFAFEAESVEGLTVKASVNGVEDVDVYSAEQFVKLEGVDNRYYVYIEGLNATQLRDEVSVTVMNGNEAVSSTLFYSVEVYAAKVFTYANVEGYENLVNLVKAMMVYGDAASAYIAK